MEPQPTRRIGVIVIEDHAAMRAALVDIVETASDLRLIGEAGTAADGLALVKEHECDVVLLDVSLPDAGVLETVASIQLLRSDAAILIASMHPEDQYAIKLLRAGIDGYFPKGQPRQELLRAIRIVAAGRKYVSPDLAKQLALSSSADAPVALHEQLGEREFEVFLRLADGHSVTEVADELNLSPVTIGHYRAAIMDKMGLSSTSDFSSYAVRNGLLD
jgi:two-component system, NarL family, invasion response regulator UvrY